MEVDHNYMPVVKINAPEFYRDQEFLDYLNNAKANGEIATWHKGLEPNDYSDVFVTCSQGEGSNSDMPEHIWDRIVEVCKPYNECLVWIQNLPVD